MANIERHIEASFQNWLVGQSFVSSGALEAQMPLRFDPDDPDLSQWLHAYIASIEGDYTRSGGWEGDVVVSVTALVRDQDNLYGKLDLSGTVGEAMSGLVLNIYDYDADATNGVKIGYVRFKEPRVSSGSLDRGTRQEVTFTITGRGYIAA